MLKYQWLLLFADWHLVAVVNSRCMQPDTVFALESYIGLVEAGVGLLPAGGGLKEIAVRVGLNPPNGDVFAGLKPYFEAVAMAKVSGSALEAKELKLARDSDVVVFNAYELLYVAKAQARQWPSPVIVHR